MYRIAHFSDFHLSDVSEVEGVCEQIEKAISLGADHVVISGDIVDCAQMGVVEIFMDALSLRGLASPEKLSIVPGNHDIFPVSRSKQLISVRPTRPTSNSQRFKVLTRPSRMATQHLCHNDDLPFGKKLAAGVVLAGLDTTRNNQFNPFKWAEGELVKQDVDAVASFFAAHPRAKHRIVVLHHYPFQVNFEHGGMVNQNFTEPEPKIVREWLLDAGATLVLCGHLHHAASELMGGDCRLVCSGAYSLNGSFYLIDLEKRGKRNVSLHI